MTEAPTRKNKVVEAHNAEAFLRFDCICDHNIKHKAVIPLTVKVQLRNEVTVLGYDGKCNIGTDISRTYTKAVETFEGADGKTRQLVTTRHAERNMRDIEAA